MAENSQVLPARSIRVRRWRLAVSVLAISLIAAAALIVPHVMYTAHAAAPKPANACMQPPTGKDPTTFTAAQLKQYGLPPRLPGQNQATWTSIVRHAQHRICAARPWNPPKGGQAAPVNKQSAGSSRYAAIQMVPVAPSRFASSVCGICYVAMLGSTLPTDANYTYGAWLVPCISAPEGGSAFSQFVFLGNLGDEGMEAGIQVTTTVVTVNAGIFRIPLTVPVYTAYVYSAGQMSSFSVNCGDTIAGLDDPFSNEVLAADLSSSSYTTLPADTSVVLNDGGCFVADPNDGAQDLMDFGTVTFSECGAAANNIFAPIWNWGPLETGGISDFTRFLANIVNPLPGTFTTTGQFSVQWFAAN